MASAPITPAPPTLSLEDENAIRAMKSTNDKRVAKRKLVEINKATLARVRVKVQCKKCSLPLLAGNYGIKRSGRQRTRVYSIVKQLLSHARYRRTLNRATIQKLVTPRAAVAQEGHAG